jgi:hypothetical protein
MALTANTAAAIALPPSSPTRASSSSLAVALVDVDVPARVTIFETPDRVPSLAPRVVATARAATTDDEFAAACIMVIAAARSSDGGEQIGARGGD